MLAPLRRGIVEIDLSIKYMNPNYQKNADNPDILTNGEVHQVRGNVSLSALSGQSLKRPRQ
jgi:hypothetical protein